MGRFLCCLLALDIPQRKTLLTMTRVQVFPDSETRIYHNERLSWNSMVYIDDYCRLPQDEGPPGYWETLRATMTGIETLVIHPIIAGIISSCLRSAPILDRSTVVESRDSTIRKELTAALGTYHPVSFDYDVILSEDRSFRYQTFARNLEPSPDVAEGVFRAFSSVLPRLAQSILLPHMSRKSVGKQTKDELLERASLDFRFKNELDDESHVTTTHLERLYFREGIAVQGPVEVRSAWKYSQLKPRVYYATGGQAYHASKYIQEVFNTLVDTMDVVHRKNRFFSPDTKLDEETTLFIYDYSSFTSNLGEIKEFTARLSLFLRGHNTYILDSHRGLISTDLGELVQHYNEVCNIYPEMDLAKVLPPEYDTETWQHTCGMLGVAGNISSCTLLHGIHTCFVVGSLFASKCVGDDAKLYIKMMKIQGKEILVDQLKNCGEIQPEKTESWQYSTDEDFLQQSWSYVKRPIARFGAREFTGLLSIFPTLDIILDLYDQDHFKLPDARTLYSRRKSFNSIWFRLLKTLYLEFPEIDEVVQQITFKFEEVAFEKLGIRDLRPGFHYKDGKPFIVPPFLQAGEFGTNPEEVFLRYYSYEEEVSVPVPAIALPQVYLYEGEVFETGSSRGLAFLEKLGLVHKEIIVEDVSRKLLGDRDFCQRLLGQYTFCYKYSVLEDLPDWAQVIL